MAKSEKRPSRLGRGLSSLMNTPVAVDTPSRPKGSPPDSEGSTSGSEREVGIDAAGSPDVPRGTPTNADGLARIGLDHIEANRHQPRQSFSDASLQELADSIRIHGVMQPVIVRRAPGTVSDRYELVAGERRWRAASLAGLETIPAIVRETGDQESAEWALIENLQREDLNPIERAEAFRQLSERFGLAHDQVAERVGLDRSTVTNLLRLLKLALDVRQLIADGLISMGHARALAGLTDPEIQTKLAAQIVREGWSVRQTEAAVRRAGQESTTAPSPSSSTPTNKSAWLTDLERQIGEQLGTKVAIRPGRKKNTGSVTIEYHTLDAFDGLLERLGVQSEQ